jgi:hypothetical protein
MIRDFFYCSTHPFQCLADALPPWAWWVIGISIALIAFGIGMRVWNLAHAVGGKPAAIGAVGILGTILVAVLSLFAGRGNDPEPSEVDGPDGVPRGEPKPLKPRRPKREPGGPIFPNAPWNRRH